MKDLADKIVNAVLFPFGRCRVRISEWGPKWDAKGLLAAIKQRGGVLAGQGGMPTASDEYYFRTPEGRLSLIMIDYGPVFLMGPKRLVRELAAQITG